jgi:hypothetical protein
MPDWLSTTLSVLTGGALTIFSGWLADGRLSKRERERRREERRERLAERHSDFQRETLLQLQVSSQKLIRATAKMLHQDKLAFRTSGKWQKQLFSEGLADEHLLQMTETMLLSSRVFDDEVRVLADILRENVTAVGGSASETDAESCMLIAGETQTKLLQRIGKLVRELDRITAASFENSALP